MTGLARAGWIAAVGAVLLYAGMTAASSVTGASQGIEIEPAYTGIFDLREGERREITLRVHNRGVDDKVLRVWGSCACTVPQKEFVALRTGESCDVPVVIDTRTAPGGNTARVFVEDEDRVRLAAASITFKSHKHFVTTPGAVTVVCGAGEQCVAKVCSLLDGEEGRTAWNDCVAVADTDALACSLVRSNPRCVALVIDALPECEAGVHSVLIRRGEMVVAAVDVGVRAAESGVSRGVRRTMADGTTEVWIEGRHGWVPTAILQPSDWTWDRVLGSDEVWRLRLTAASVPTGTWTVSLERGNELCRESVSAEGDEE